MSAAISADRQWLRYCSLTVGSGGTGVELAGLHIKFQTQKGDVQTPNSATITVYNLSDATVARIGGEFSRAVLDAGYQGRHGVIFDGTIRQVRNWREGVDRITEITVADGDRAYNHAVVSTTLAAGSRPADRVQAAGQAMAAHGTTIGYVADLAGQALPRGRVLFGMARDQLRTAAADTDSSWSIQDGQLQVVASSSYLPGDAVVLTAETGMIGSPEQTENGITVQALINPSFRIGGRIQLDNASIRRAKRSLQLGAWDKSVRLDSDGYYRILKAEFSGDTHGTDWYASLVTIGIDDTSRIPLDRI